MKFEWDENKNKLNIAKHNVSFKIAESVFDDKNAVYMYDEKHSANEDRFIIIGKEDTLRMELTVCHCYKGKNEEVVRIISARKASKKEINIYISGGAEE
ncbi:MAG: BrnT family toxin [Defluviitaleaceae bacterium]|nr:BrnT family toxin [Defluviitaleaceae bacterium]